MSSERFTATYPRGTPQSVVVAGAVAIDPGRETAAASALVDEDAASRAKLRSACDPVEDGHGGGNR